MCVCNICESCGYCVQSEPHDLQCNEESDMNDWSAFEDEVRSNTRQRGPRCAIGVILENVPDDVRVELEGVILRYPAPAVRRALVGRLGDDCTPSEWSISHHRRGKCACQR